MIEYIYIVKCPGREDEMFNFFTDARMQCDLLMSKKPIITQVEVERNDFGECTDSRDLGTVWSWEEAMKDTEGGYTDAEPAKSIFTKDDVASLGGDYNPDNDSEFTDIDNSVDFEVEEASDKESLKEAYELKGETTKGELYELLVNQGQTVTLDLGDCQELGEQFSANDYNNSELTIVFNTKGRVYPVDTFSAYETRYSDDGNTIDGDFELETTSFETLWDELLKVAPEFFVDDTRMPVPEGMTIEQLVEEMEENEDTVECTWCEELFDKSECRKEVDLGWLCSRCEMAIKSRGETLTFREGNYWDFLDEDLDDTRTLADLVKDSINHLTNDLGKDPWAEDFADDVIKDIENNYDIEVPEDPVKYIDWASAVASEVSRQLNNQPQLDEELETKTWICVFEGNEIGTVEATTEEEAGEKMQRKYPEYPYGLYDGCFEVYPAEEEELTEAKELHDLGSTYDGGYPEEKPELLEIPEVSDPYLKLCPECGKETFDIETGICVECGFN